VEKTKGGYALPALQASHCDGSVCMETEACKKGAKETQNGNYLYYIYIVQNFLLRLIFSEACILYYPAN
jgi:hypothetical protein